MHIIGSLVSEPDFPDQGGPDDATDSGSGSGDDLTSAKAAARLLNVGTIVDACVKYGVNP